MESPQPLGLVNEGSLLALGQGLPLGSEPFGDLRVVHFGVLLSHLSSLASRPYHEGVHRPLYPIRIVLIVGAMLVRHALHIVVVRVWRSGRGHFPTSRPC